MSLSFIVTLALAALLLFVWRRPHHRNPIRALTPANCNHGARQGHTGDFRFDESGAYCPHCRLHGSRPSDALLRRFGLHR